LFIYNNPFIFAKNKEYMDTLNIKVSKQMDGFVFGLDPLVRRELTTIFPKLQPLKSIFVSYDTKADWKNLYSRLQKHIFPALIGVDTTAELEGKIHEVRFIEAVTERSIHTFEI
jgi:predicted aldo/keto reductase-like oxidoreductase